MPHNDQLQCRLGNEAATAGFPLVLLSFGQDSVDHQGHHQHHAREQSPGQLVDPGNVTEPYPEHGEG